MRFLLKISTLIWITFLSVSASADELVDEAFKFTHEYLVGAMICEDYIGQEHKLHARELVRRLWVTGGYDGELLEKAVAKSEEMLIDQIGGRALANQMPGYFTNDDQELACTQLLAVAQSKAEGAVSVLE